MIKTKKNGDIASAIKRFENLPKYFCDGDAYGAGLWMSLEDKYEKGDYVRIEDLQKVIDDLKSITL